MKIVENNAECGEIIIFDHKFYKKITKFPSNLSLWWGFCLKKLSLGGVFERKSQWPRVSLAGGGGGGEGIAIAQGDICISVASPGLKVYMWLTVTSTVSACQ